MVTHKRDVKPGVRNIIFANAGGYCSISGCNKSLTRDNFDPKNPKNIGEVAHIVPLDENDKRFDPSYPIEKLNDYENLIFVCPNCHEDIDKLHKYTLQQLRDFKLMHEKKVSYKLREDMPEISYKELAVVCEYVASQDLSPVEDLRVIPIQEKIDKNNLRLAEDKILLGLSQVHLVKDYITHIGKLDQDFIRRLRNGFVIKYNEGVALGLQGANLFNYLHEFAFQSRTEDDYLAASLAVLVYFFEACDVFEK